MRPGAALVLLLAAASGGGCRQLFGIDDTSVARDGGLDDAPPGWADAGIDAVQAPDAAACAGIEYGTGILRICLAAAPTGAYALGGQETFDTGTASECAPAQDPGYCVVAYDTFVVALGGRLRLIGSRPLVLVARTITIDGRLDAATRTSFNTGGELAGIGPGADSNLCLPSVLPMLVGDAGGGGAGGSFGGRGGAGGAARPGGTSGGIPADPTGTLTTLRGGCPGDAGAGPQGGEAGGGGGAVYLIATERIEVAIGAWINASGAAGRRGERNGGISSGGGGGGSGGMIGLDAPTIEVVGMVYANGGGAGKGGRNGSDGYNPTTAYTPAMGGFGGAGNGGEGGDGSAADQLSGENGADGLAPDGAGGGGGGGAGVIRVFSPGGIQGQGLVSPPAT